MIPQVSVILPTFNERDNIVPLASAIQKELNGYSYEILIVDDQSSDGTAQIASRINDPAVAVIVRGKDPGYAKSIACGIQHSQGDILIIMDSDFNHNPGELRGMLRRLNSCDVVCGSRFLPGGSMRPYWRNICSYAFNRFISLATASPLSDHLFGYFALKRSCLLQIPPGKIFYGFGDYGIRLLYHLQKASVRIAEVPSVCDPRKSGQGNKRFIKTFIQYLRATLDVVRQSRQA